MMPTEILSLGAGVQSTTCYLMSAMGELPKLDLAVFADTHWEPARVHEHLKYLEDLSLKVKIPIVRVSAGPLRQHALESQVHGGRALDGARWASMPLFTRKVWKPSHGDIKLLDEIIDERVSAGKPTDKLQGIRNILLSGKDFTQDGMIRRQCTNEYKIRPIEKAIRKHCGYEGRKRIPPATVRQWIGISADGFQRRITRQDCLNWLFDRGFPEPPRSACIGCPFHTDVEWLEIKENRPREWSNVVEFDRGVRDCGSMRGQCFLHRQRVPLDEVKLRDTKGLKIINPWQDECSGFCGI